MAQVFGDVGLIGGEESEIHAFQMFGQNSLDERRLIIDLLELAEHVFLIQKLDIDGGKAALTEYVADFLALEGGGPDKGDGKEIGASWRMGS